MKMKNRKGSILVMTLMVFVVLMIFGTFILGFMVTENKMSINHQNKTQAYYIARSGVVAVEAAIMDMDEDERENLMKSIPVDAEIDNLEFNKGSLELVSIKKDGNNIIIESKAKINNIKQTVKKVIEVEEVSGGSKVEIDTAVHANGKITIKSGEVRGDVTSNQGPIEKTQYNGKIIGKEEIVNPPKEYSLPIFPEKDKDIEDLPEFPAYNPLVDKSDNLVFSGSINEITIDSNMQYEKIEIPYSKSLIIDASKSDVNIWVEEINLLGTDKAHGNIRILGSNTVNIYIKENFKINSSLPITKTNKLAGVNIYYGGKNISINGVEQGIIPANIYLNPSNLSSPDIAFRNSRVKGDIYVYRGQFSMSGNSNIGIDGNIHLKTGKISMSNGGINGSIFAMNGDIQISGSAIMNGGIYSISGNIELSGSGTNQGEIYTRAGNIEISGSGRVVQGNVYTNEGDIKFSGSGKIDGNIYARKGDIYMSTSEVIKGDIYSGDGNIKFTNSTTLNGNIVASGNQNIEFENGGTKISGLIYAPKTDVYFKSSAKLYGAIIADTLDMNNGGALVEYNGDNFDFDNIHIPNIKPTTSFKPGYFK